MSDARTKAAEYWSRYEVELAFEEPWQLKGTVEALREVKNHKDAWVPRVAVRGVVTKKGIVGADGLYLLTAHPTRLRAELKLWAPAIGDRIWVEYLGEEERAAPGHNKTKRFRVVVKPPGSPPPPETADGFGEVASAENGTEEGT